MSRYIYFSTNKQYYQYSVAAAKQAGNVSVFRDFINDCAIKLFAFHNAWPLNKHGELPLKSLWFKRCLNGINVCSEADECVYVIMAENFHFSYSRRFLHYLRTVYPGCKICMQLSNPLDKDNAPRIMHMKPCYDAVITFYESDAIQYSLYYTSIWPYALPQKDNKLEVKSDVFFIGKNKNRLNLLISVYEKLTKEGLICDFHIIDVKDDEMKYSDKIHYNFGLSYEDVLKHVQETKCILEILQDNEDYISIKTFEAAQYEKKLLTTNKKLRDSEYYRYDIMQVFSTAEDIDVEFINLQLVTVDFLKIKELSSFIKFEEYVENILN